MLAAESSAKDFSEKINKKMAAVVLSQRQPDLKIVKNASRVLL
jgi:hypothetical protein